MKKYRVELIMACLMLVCFYLLSRQAAVLSENMLGVTASSQVNEKENDKKILIDPGHGESDPGMIGIDGLEEKGINLEISLLLCEQLKQRGYSVVMTRESDRGLYDASSQNKKAQDMQRRVAMISEEKPLLSVSIHQNSYQDQRVYGPQVFYYESSVEGKKLAQSIQSNLNTSLQIAHAREVKGNTSYYLLKRSEGTLVIVECGFLTNPDDAKKLQQQDYQEQVAEAIADGIESYIEENQTTG